MNSQHVYNLIAKEIRKGLEQQEDHTIAIMTLGALAISFAKRFNDNEDFNPRTFLGRCTHDAFKLNLVLYWDQLEDDGA